MTISVNQEKILVDAFKDVVCPKREGLLRSDVVDDSDVVFLYNYVNKSWTDLDSNELSNESSCLTSLSDDGLLFIIPAYLKMYIHGEDDKILPLNYTQPNSVIKCSGHLMVYTHGEEVSILINQRIESLLND